MKQYCSLLFFLVMSFTLTLLFSSPVFSQENYVSAYLIDLNRDTIKGYADNKNWLVNPIEITFKKSFTEAAKTYTTSDIIEVNLGTDIYVSAKVNVETSPRLVNELGRDAEFHFREEEVFLRTLVKAEKSLYLYHDKEGRDHFYIKTGDDYLLLKYKQYLRSDNNKTAIKLNDLRLYEVDGNLHLIEVNQYRGQLNYYLRDNEDIALKTKEISYNERSLTKLFQWYLKDKEMEFSASNGAPIAKFGIVAGYSFTDVMLQGVDVEEYLLSAEFPYSANPFAGVNLALYNSRGRYPLVFYNELIYFNYHSTGRTEYISNLSTEPSTIYDLELGLGYIQLNSLLRIYLRDMESSKFFLNAGLSNGFLVREINSRVQVPEPTSYLSYNHKVIEDLNRHDLGYLFGAGIEFGKFCIETRYGNAYSFKLAQTATIHTQRFYFLLGYTF